jgi:hypothetical protein
MTVEVRERTADLCGMTTRKATATANAWRQQIGGHYTERQKSYAKSPLREPVAIRKATAIGYLQYKNAGV